MSKEDDGNSVSSVSTSGSRIKAAFYAGKKGRATLHKKSSSLHRKDSGSSLKFPYIKNPNNIFSPPQEPRSKYVPSSSLADFNKKHRHRSSSHHYGSGGGKAVLGRLNAKMSMKPPATNSNTSESSNVSNPMHTPQGNREGGTPRRKGSILKVLPDSSTGLSRLPITKYAGKYMYL
jgi:hypothetical protein